MKKNIIFSSFNMAAVATTALLASACTANYLNINTNPYEVSKEQMEADGYGLGAALNGMAGVVISTNVNTAQFTENLLGCTQGGYFGDTGSWRYTISQFDATDDWTRVFLASDQVIPLFYSNYTEINRITDDPVPLALADILKVAVMHRVADTYGPIPYTQIGADGQIAVPYDSEKTVYETMITELGAAVDTLLKYPVSAVPETADYIYGGNICKWAKYANSLRLRLAMRIVNVDEDFARQAAEAAAGSAAGFISDNSDIAQFSSFGTSGNPIYAAAWYNVADIDGHVCRTGGESHASADITSYMNAYNDPRRAAYFIDSEWPGQQYCGIRRGIERPSINAAGHQYSGINITSQSPLVWMNAAEVAFLKAEAAGVYGFDMGGSAQQFYEEGIRLSFSQYGVEGADSYMQQDTPVTVSYTDPWTEDNPNGRVEPISAPSVKWHEDGAMQQRIIIQKWIANWILGNEAWADYRRTGFPELFPASEAGNRAPSTVDSRRGARRMPYPQAEYTNNPYMGEAVSMLGGPDNMGTDVWWAKKN